MGLEVDKKYKEVERGCCMAKFLFPYLHPVKEVTGELFLNILCQK